MTGKAVNDLITDLSSRHRGYNIIVGDFNHHIDWPNDMKPSDRSTVVNSLSKPCRITSLANIS